MFGHGSLWRSDLGRHVFVVGRDLGPGFVHSQVSVCQPCTVLYVKEFVCQRYIISSSPLVVGP